MVDDPARTAAPGMRPGAVGGFAEEGSSPDLEAGALGGVMVALAWVPRLVTLHLCWVGLVLLGGVIAGIAPATTTMIAVLRGEERYGSAVRRFRQELIPANVAAGPFLLLAGFAVLDLVLGIAGLLPAWFVPGGLAASLVLAGCAVLAIPHALCLRALRPAGAAPVIWRAALAGPVLLPVATASWAITLAATVVISLLVKPVALLMAGGILVAVTTLVLHRSWQIRLDTACDVAHVSRGVS